MVDARSVRSLHPALAPLAVVAGVVAMYAGMAAGRGLGLRPALILGEACLPLPGLLLMALARAPLRDGLGLRRIAPRHLALACAGGACLWAASLGLLELQYVVWRPPEGYLDFFRSLHEALRPRSAADAAFSVAAIALAPAVCEEVLFRGVVLGSLRPALGGLLAVALSALLFGAVHLDFAAGGPPVLYRIPFAIVVGIGLGGMRLVTGSLAAPIAAHAVLNTITFVIALVQELPEGLPEPRPPLLGAGLLGLGGAATLGVLRLLRRSRSGTTAPRA
jgi:membrane protease YdiL (CAAX protease family)